MKKFILSASLVLSFIFALSILTVRTAQAQTYTLLHDFTGGADGGNPESSPLVDAAGNLYGTTSIGGVGYGVVFKLTHKNSGWIFNVLYTFQSGLDGAAPFASLIFGPDGALYGTTAYGGGGDCRSGTGFLGCGTVFKLMPPPTVCPTTSCPWIETILYRFLGGHDAQYPWSRLTFDPAGNIYGTTVQGGTLGAGTVYKLARSNGGWSETVIHTFSGPDGYGPHSEVIFDTAGNLYGTTYQGGSDDFGVVYELSPTQSGWVETVIYNAVGRPAPQYTGAGVTFGSPNILYGASVEGGQNNGGTVFTLSLANGAWTESTLYAFQNNGGGPVGTPALDQAGNIYDATFSQGRGCGSIFKLTHSGANWTFTDLHDFTDTDGCYPYDGVRFDTAGNMFGATYAGGSSICFPGGGGCGIVWEITP